MKDPNFHNIRIGLSDVVIQQCTDETALTNKQIMLQSITPKNFGRGIEPNFLDFVSLVQKGKKVVCDRSSNFDESAKNYLNCIDFSGRLVNIRISRPKQWPTD